MIKMQTKLGTGGKVKIPRFLPRNKCTYFRYARPQTIFLALQFFAQVVANNFVME